jgi:hypothetical protein
MAVITEKNLIKTEVIFSKDKQHRYLLRKEWDKGKDKAMVVMINPSLAGEILMDHTTMYVINNLVRLDFGSVDIVNIFSNVDGSRKARESILESDQENEKQILTSAEKVDKIIIAWGKVGDKNKYIQEKQDVILKLLGRFGEKFFTIGDNRGKVGLHPLVPTIRSNWNLIKNPLKGDEEVELVEETQE